MRKLRGTLEHFGLPCPGFDYLCTYRIAQRVWPDLPSHALGALAAHIGHQFHHHHAQADAEAAGWVFQSLMRHAKVKTPASLAKMPGIQIGLGCRGSVIPLREKHHPRSARSVSPGMAAIAPA